LLAARRFRERLMEINEMQGNGPRPESVAALFALGICAVALEFKHRAREHS
jgi:hypothetical protein